jgi:hypothetical protein
MTPEKEAIEGAKKDMVHYMAQTIKALTLIWSDLQVGEYNTFQDLTHEKFRFFNTAIQGINLLTGADSCAYCHYYGIRTCTRNYKACPVMLHHRCCHGDKSTYQKFKRTLFTLGAYNNQLYDHPEQAP